MMSMSELARVVSQIGLEALLEHVHAMVLLLGPDGRLIAWNSAFAAIKAGFPKASQMEDFMPQEERTEFRRRLKVSLDNGRRSRWRVSFLMDAGDSQIHCDCLLLPASDGRAILIAEQVATDPAISQIIDKMSRQIKLFRIESEHVKKLAMNKQAEVEAVVAQAHEVSNLDELTFLPNRRQIIRELQQEVVRAERYGSLLSISILDVDHFKAVNDTYGHVVGDQVLREIAGKLRDNVRYPDTVARYGGEEFLILLPSSTKEAASEQAERLCKYVRDAVIQVEQQAIRVTLSIGVAQFRNGVDNWHTLLSRADTAMYDAKKAGRDRWAVSTG